MRAERGDPPKVHAHYTSLYLSTHAEIACLPEPWHRLGIYLSHPWNLDTGSPAGMTNTCHCEFLTKVRNVAIFFRFPSGYPSLGSTYTRRLLLPQLRDRTDKKRKTSRRFQTFGRF